MNDKNKDKIIVGLIIAIALLLGNNIVKSHSDKTIGNKQSLFEAEDDMILDSNQASSENFAEDIKEDSEKKVHISGEINQEGVYIIDDGDRLDDLIKQAGGLTSEANVNSLNLAMKLEDQMKIYIPNKNEIPAEELTTQIVTSPELSNNSDKININQASKEELMTLPNIGEKRAEAIIEYRNVNKFENIEDIKNVTGIGDKFFEAMKDLITV
ncbi:MULTISPECIES: helix-hairpin-helix domain-containing protein [Anaerococcus]|uniref:Competence protein ComEA n=1 Tax=Anaerococcus nagyae TaxID=1755241 RepID=A0A3E2TIN0_9FIRM|nr:MULTISPECIES: helix-hairpin-helix domain-containing protein [Anaerococcus]MDU2354142.1 helix-hairpin-helix domain-containing protein [Anaerococcus sp.]MDU3211299.1 helix-hairpin-helix domain-containing protein [Anaerococcus sp.]RGB76550.1 competence protein ComEA [Anaerococcus nagyae]